MSCICLPAARRWRRVRPAAAGEARIDRLIERSSALPTIGQRIDFISRALIGTRYRGYTLIGGPHRREHMWCATTVSTA